MNKLLLTLLSMLLIFNVCCKSGTELKSLTFGEIQLTIPGDAFFKKSNGIDSYVGIIVYNSDTFNLEYGKHAYDLSESVPTVFPLKEKANLEKLYGEGFESRTNTVFSDSAEEDREERTYAKNYSFRDTINHLPVRIVQPKKIGDGITGMYIRRIRDSNDFSIYATNLDSQAHRQALNIFRSVQLKSK